MPLPDKRNFIEPSTLESLEAEPGGQFHVRTFGCQMNQHDAQKMANLLHHAGLRARRIRPSARTWSSIHTCSIREKAEHRLYTELGILLARKREEPDLVIGVGGCVAQQEGESLLGASLAWISCSVRKTCPLAGDGRAARERVRVLRVDYDDAPRRASTCPDATPPTAHRRPDAPSSRSWRAATSSARTASCRARAGAR